MNKSSNPIIKVENLVKRFGSFEANKSLCFEVYPGEIFGFLGANGAGKTTAIKILCGLSSPTSGTVEVAGINVKKKPEEVKKNIGYMSQKFSLYEDLTVAENFSFYGGIYGLRFREIKSKMKNILDKAGIYELRNQLVGSIPPGWKQRLAFAVATFHNPAIVFLDEPTGGVDPITRRKFWDMIYDASKRGITVFVTTHYMDEAEYCNRVSIMVDGEIKALDTPDNLKSTFNSSSMEEVFYKLSSSQFLSTNK